MENIFKKNIDKELWGTFFIVNNSLLRTLRYASLNSH